MSKAEFLEIEGGIALRGTVTVSGAKNAALPLLIASLLSSEKCEFLNVPNIEDISLTLHLLEHFGAQTERVNGKVSIQVPQLLATEASYSLVKALRASFWVLGPLLARGRAARVALPGGDIIGARPVDMHLAVLEAMGAQIQVKHGIVLATAVNGLRPVDFELRFPSVGATHQVIMAAALTPGTTVLRGAAREPEIAALAELINRMGGDVEGAGSPTIIIRGKSELGSAHVSLIGDRIEAGTYLLAAAATGGNVRVQGISPEFLSSLLDLLQEAGSTIETGSDFVQLSQQQLLKAFKCKTGPFPELATDFQAPLMAALCRASGQSVIEENVFEGRFGHVAELCRMGAQIRVEERSAYIQGVERLSGAPVDCHDIRAGAALVIAALSAEGVSWLYEPQHLKRGYEGLEVKLRSLGAKVGAKLADPEDYMFTGC